MSGGSDALKVLSTDQEGAAGCGGSRQRQRADLGPSPIQPRSTVLLSVRMERRWRRVAPTLPRGSGAWTATGLRRRWSTRRRSARWPLTPAAPSSGRDARTGQCVFGRHHRGGAWTSSFRMRRRFARFGFGLRFRRFAGDGQRRPDRPGLGTPDRDRRSRAVFHRGWVRVLAFNADGTQVLTGGSDRMARLWSVDSGEPIGSALEHFSGVSAAGFRPGNSGMLLSAGGKFVHLWRMKEDGGELHPSIEFSLQCGDVVEHAAFTPGGRRFVVLTRSWLCSMC